jgi:hypothetical protein
MIEVIPTLIVSPLLKRDQFPAIWDRAMTDANYFVAMYWFQNYLKLHFEESAYTRYSGVYQQRSTKYNKQKGHRRPMVGLEAPNPRASASHMRDELMRSCSVSVTANSAAVLMHARALNFSSPARVASKGYPDFRAEIRAVNSAEAKRFATMLGEFFEKRIASLNIQLSGEPLSA